MSEQVAFRMVGGKVQTQVLKAGQPPNPAMWRCAPCENGAGDCCTRVPESLPPTARKVLGKAATAKADDREAYLRGQIEAIKKGVVKL